MTISVCYLSREGVVLGADSTTTMPSFDGGSDQYFDHHQKILEIGEDSTLGIVTWGLGSLGQRSYRSAVAEFQDELKAHPADSVQEVAERWASIIWGEYTTNLAPLIHRYHDLKRISPRSEDEEKEYNRLRSLAGGFCLGGRIATKRQPEAYAITYSPEMDSPKIEQLEYDRPRFWGVPNLMHRLIVGTDDPLIYRILNSGKWNGTSQDLIDIIKPGVLTIPGQLPIREAVDWVFAAIFITIKAVKFSKMPPICGGPVEIAVVTTDRGFRWVRHKRMDEVLRQISTQGNMP